MNRKHQLWCAWSGPAFAGLFGLGFCVFARFLPAHAPGDSAEQIAAIYRDNAGMIRLGQLLVMIASGLAFAFVSVISTQMTRIEGRLPVLANLQLAAGIGATLLLLLPGMLWTVAAFRPERAPELTLLVNDAAWLILLMPFSPAGIQLLAIGFATLGDRSGTPVFPRWAGFFNLWMAVLFLPGGLVTFFKSGPFAWNGLFGFWVPFAAFFAWVVVMTVLLIQTIKRQPSN